MQILIFKAKRLVDIKTSQKIICTEYKFNYKSFVRKQWVDDIKKYKAYTFVRLYPNLYSYDVPLFIDE